MKYGSTIFRLTDCDNFFTYITISNGLHLSDSGKGSWSRDARRSYRVLQSEIHNGYDILR